ncbi:MAG: lipoyl synthase [Candidatus Erginobacter occultus]|nr:lipoyl synthase [Candidatus Erginobacter occultus]
MLRYWKITAISAHPIMRCPPYLLKKVRLGGKTFRLKQRLRSLGVATVCEQALCPNISECFTAGELTFMAMGEICTRSCRFCGVNRGRPLPLDPEEPEKIARAARELKLNFVVITSVTRDDLVDGGAAHLAAVIRRVKEELPESGVEVLVPDFGGNPAALNTVLEAGPDVIGHNLETVRRLYPQARRDSDYRRSLKVLSSAARSGKIPVKSGFMVGLGETEEEIEELMSDIFTAGARMLTIGHYLPPTARHLPLVRPRPEEKFAQYRRRAQALGFPSVRSGVFVRSSHRAREQWADLINYRKRFNLTKAE